MSGTVRLVMVGYCTVCGRSVYRQNGSTAQPAMNRNGRQHLHKQPWRISPPERTPEETP